jgi:RNA polymerase sigma-70 factor (ECF subfamily)
MGGTSDALGGNAPLTVTVTTTVLLAGLKDPANHAVWQQYVERFRPLIVGYATRVGLTPENAEDLAQTSLVDFATDYAAGKYDRAQGRLRNWLFGIVRNRIRSAARVATRRPANAASTAILAGLAAPDDLDELWESQWRDEILRQGLEELRREVQPTTFEAFRLFVSESLPAEEVARRTGLTPNAVYGAKRRMLARLRELMPLLEDS